MRHEAVSPRWNRTLPRELNEEVRALGRHAESVLDREFVSDGGTRTHDARTLLNSIWTDTLSIVSAADPMDAPSRLGPLTGLLCAVRDLESRINESLINDSTEVMRSIRRSLRRFHSARTIDELFQTAAEEVCTIGFDRALVSTVDKSRWNLRTMAVPRDPRLAEEMVAAGRDAPPILDGSLVETDVVDSRRAGLVYDVQHNPRVNRTLVSMSGCESYGVAPIQVHDRVVGLVHADSHYAYRPVDETDQTVLNLFAEGLGHAMVRTTVLTQVSALQGTLQELTGDPFETAGPREPGNLSARELEVLSLMAEGASNRLIANRLSISEGTVKTHVTHILRKLDANNRAEAVAYWLRS